MKLQIPLYDSSQGSYQSNKQYKHALHSDIEKQSMCYNGPARNPVIVIHGFLGSKLVDRESSESVWGEFKEVDLIRGYSKTQLRKLAHPLGHDKPLTELRDETFSAGMMTNYSVRILGLHLEKGAYGKMINTLTDAGYIDEDTKTTDKELLPNLYKFYYDWRRDISETAKELHKFIIEKKKFIQKKYYEFFQIKDHDVQFDIVAHSMGGLLTRYYLRYEDKILPEDFSVPEPTWNGTKNIDKVFLVGTPNGGYIDTLTELVGGLKIINHGPVIPPEIIGTFPSYYQMLPYMANKHITHCGEIDHSIDLFDYKTWEKFKWGLANIKEDRYFRILHPHLSEHDHKKTIIEHLDKCLKRARQFHKALLTASNSEKTMSEMHLFLGNSVKTSRIVNIDKEGKIAVTKSEAGDGKVLVSSALMDTREISGWKPFLQSPIKWRSIIHIEAAHMGITESNTFSDNLIFYLLSVPSKKQIIRK